MDQSFVTAFMSVNLEAPKCSIEVDQFRVFAYNPLLSPLDRSSTYSASRTAILSDLYFDRGLAPNLPDGFD